MEILKGTDRSPATTIAARGTLRRDCPECGSIGSVALDLCVVCGAEVGARPVGPIVMSSDLFWDLSFDEYLLEPDQLAYDPDRQYA